MQFANQIADCDRLKQEIDRHRPLKGQALKQLREYFRIRLIWTSNALEGNSLTETETKVVIMDGIAIGGKPLRDHYEASGHAEAFDQVTIHPFTDGNGRAVRLLMNLALIQAGFPVTIIPPVLRSDYLTAIRKGDAGDHQPFLCLLSNMVREGQRDYLRLLQSMERR